jgi:hypothetical protein
MRVANATNGPPSPSALGEGSGGEGPCRHDAVFIRIRYERYLVDRGHSVSDGRHGRTAGDFNGAEIGPDPGWSPAPRLDSNR